MPVALLAEGVDRNKSLLVGVVMPDASPSSRRAWIEIAFFSIKDAMAFSSPSSRRAWIEIALERLNQRLDNVALLAEGVDRN